ncbi:MAG: squalene/phytoene synthase family protein, partial [Nannocystaceae bacterium]
MSMPNATTTTDTAEVLEPSEDRPRGVSGLLRRMTERSSSNFKFAFMFLGHERAEGLHLVYEFCRVVDDIVDEREPGPAGDALARRRLDEWTREIGRVYASAPADDEPLTELGRGLRRTNAAFEYPR